MLRLAARPDDLARAAGLAPPVERWRLCYEASRRVHPTSGDPALAARRSAAIRAELEAAPAAQAIELPLPLPPEVWRQSILSRRVPDAELGRALLLERPAALLYRGLLQLDPPTRAWFERNAGLVKWIRDARPEAFATSAASLSVLDGRTVVPGGDEAIPLWERAVGCPTAQPRRFVRRLLELEEGRLALLYHSVHGLDPARQRFALGLAESDANHRDDRFRALASTFARAAPWWRGDGLSRPPFDPATVLASVAVTDEGRLAGPATRAFWDLAYAESGGAPSPAALRCGPAADAAWLAAQIGLASTPRARTRLMQLAFAQRVFGAAPEAALPDVLAAVRGLARRPALVLVLERMGVREASVYARALRSAEALEARDDRRERTRVLAVFQGALALVDRAHQSACLDTAAAERLVASLSETALGPPHEFALWLEGQLLPALVRAVYGDAPPGPAEETVLRAISGAGATGAPARPVFDWEGEPSRADPAAGEYLRLRRVRARQHGHALEAVLSFARAAREAAEEPGNSAALAALEALRPDPAVYPAGGEALDPAAFRRDPASARGELLRLSEALLAEALVSLAYAPQIGAADGPVLAGANVALRHELGAQPFAFPREISGTGGPWRVEGALLGLELALAPLSLRRIAADVPSGPPRFDLAARSGFALSVALRSPFALRDADARAMLAAIERGRSRMLALRENPAAAPGVARDAAVEPWRAQALPWLLAHEPDALERFFSLGELWRLGGREPVPDDGWGLPALALGGGLRLQPPAPLLLERSTGQEQSALLAAAWEEPLLEVVSRLSARALPVCLTPALLALVTQSIDDEAPPSIVDDPYALRRYLRELPPERFDDYVSALAGDGPLQPAPEPAASEGRP